MPDRPALHGQPDPGVQAAADPPSPGSPRVGNRPWGDASPDLTDNLDGTADVGPETSPGVMTGAGMFAFFAVFAALFTFGVVMLQYSEFCRLPDLDHRITQLDSRRNRRGYPVHLVRLEGIEKEIRVRQEVYEKCRVGEVLRRNQDRLSFEVGGSEVLFVPATLLLLGAAVAGAGLLATVVAVTTWRCSWLGKNLDRRGGSLGMLLFVIWFVLLCREVSR